MTKKQLAQLIIKYMACIQNVPMRSVDCDQDEELELSDKLETWAWNELGMFDGLSRKS